MIRKLDVSELNAVSGGADEPGDDTGDVPFFDDPDTFDPTGDGGGSDTGSDTGTDPGNDTGTDPGNDSYTPSTTDVPSPSSALNDGSSRGGSAPPSLFPPSPTITGPTIDLGGGTSVKVGVLGPVTNPTGVGGTVKISF